MELLHEINEFPFKYIFTASSIPSISVIMGSMPAFQAFIGSISHTSGYQNLAIQYVGQHTGMLSLRCGIHAMFFIVTTLIFMTIMATCGMVSRFISFFFAYYFAILLP